ncbi:MAG: acyltransferase [Calditrichaeota bacterium]|nr:acyltransferase [Candidatus Cloacimonadota bacterium]MCB1048026.1 acyltransferase [Calditrichota bacterium]
MIVAAVQTRPEFGRPGVNTMRALEMMGSTPADLYVLPELFSSGYFFQSRAEALTAGESLDGPVVTALKDFSHRQRCTIHAGIPERDGDAIYNSSVLVHHGALVAVYRKIHLFNTEKNCFDPGDRAPAVVDAGARLGLMICFDWIFPELARSLALQGAQILCHPANLVLAWCQKAMVIRSVENRVFSILCNRVGSEERNGVSLTFTGGSEIVHPRGEILASASADAEELIWAVIDPTDADEKMITSTNHVLNDRRPEFYFGAPGEFSADPSR